MVQHANSNQDPELGPALLERVVSEVLGQVAFIFVEALDEAPKWIDDELVETRLSFTGDVRGDLLLTCGQALGTEFAANLLGLDSGEDPEIEAESRDALGEILNIIAGPLLATWQGERAVCNIGPPVGTAATPGTHCVHVAEATCTLAFRTEEGMLFEMAVFLA